jgi:hypothetical protein
MSPTLIVLLYLSLGLALSILRLGQGRPTGDALFGGLFWPMEWAACGIRLAAEDLLEQR